MSFIFTGFFVLLEAFIKCFFASQDGTPKLFSFEGKQNLKPVA